MIFENNYAYAGTTAIIYNFEIDHSTLRFYIDSNNKILLPLDSTLKEIGVEYKKSSESEWHQIVIAGTNVLNSIKNGINAQVAIPHYECNEYLVARPIGLYKCNHMSPIRVVIKNLEESTNYNLRSYYLLTNNNTKSSFNYSTVTTLTRQDVFYECTAVTGGTAEENAQLLANINKACDIYNSMTAFTRSSPSSNDKLNSRTGGSFTATLVGDTLGGNFVANSDMKFRYPDASVGVICHEMAHNVMKRTIDETADPETYPNAYNEIVKFMEFATHGHAATWRWNTNHNYPVISSANYQGVMNYLVAAACYTCRKASDRI